VCVFINRNNLLVIIRSVSCVDSTGFSSSIVYVEILKKCTPEYSCVLPTRELYVAPLGPLFRVHRARKPVSVLLNRTRSTVRSLMYNKIQEKARPHGVLFWCSSLNVLLS
jgi:hypothetical protein